MANLDRIAAQHAQKIIEDTKQFTDEGQQKPISKDEVENVLTKALGVCQEQGIYAGLLYLLSRSNKTEKIIAKAIKQELVALLGEPELATLGLAYGNADGNAGDAHALLDHFAGTVCAAPVQTVLFIKDLFERTLTYARYSAKARQN
jgi:hypothetical protein